MKLFVLVDVTYDYYRFQENLKASTDKESLIRWAKQLMNKNIYKYRLKEVETYKEGFCSDKISIDELSHFWIQEFNNHDTST